MVPVGRGPAPPALAPIVGEVAGPVIGLSETCSCVRRDWLGSLARVHETSDSPNNTFQKYVI